MGIISPLWSLSLRVGIPHVLSWSLFILLLFLLVSLILELLVLLLLLLDLDHFHILPHFVLLLLLLLLVLELDFNTVCFNTSLFINDDAVADEAVVVFVVSLLGFTK